MRLWQTQDTLTITKKLRINKNAVIHFNDIKVLGAQAAAEVDVTAATAVVIGDLTATNSTPYGATSEAGFDSIATNLDKVIVNVETMRVTVNSLLAKLRTHGIIAS